MQLLNSVMSEPQLSNLTLDVSECLFESLNLQNHQLAIGVQSLKLCFLDPSQTFAPHDFRFLRGLKALTYLDLLFGAPEDDDGGAEHLRNCLASVPPNLRYLDVSAYRIVEGQPRDFAARLLRQFLEQASTSTLECVRYEGVSEEKNKAEMVNQSMIILLERSCAVRGVRFEFADQWDD